MYSTHGIPRRWEVADTADAIAAIREAR